MRTLISGCIASAAGLVFKFWAWGQMFVSRTFTIKSKVFLVWCRRVRVGQVHRRKIIMCADVSFFALPQKNVKNAAFIPVTGITAMVRGFVKSRLRSGPC